MTTSAPTTGGPAPRVVQGSDLAVLADMIRSRIAPGSRFILGLAGAPGTGKSTLAKALAQALAPLRTIVVPADGFHLAARVLRGTTLEHRKGAIDTFDAAGYAHLIHRLRDQQDPAVYAPSYERSVEEPIAGAIAVDRDVQVIITEGNYLLVDDPSWGRARSDMDQVWFVDTPDDVRIPRLVERHIRFGKSENAARDWVATSDEVNAALVQSTRVHADLAVYWV